MCLNLHGKARQILDSDSQLKNNSMLRVLIKEQWDKFKIANKIKLTLFDSLTIEFFIFKARIK